MSRTLSALQSAHKQPAVWATHALTLSCADVDVRSAALNRWSLKQAQFALSRQRVAQLFGMPTHFPRLDGGYEFEGQYEDFFALDSADDPSENLRMYTFNEARRAGRLAEVAVEGIDGLNELVATQLERLEEQQQQSEARLERKLDALSASMEAIGKQLGAGR